MRKLGIGMAVLCLLSVPTVAQSRSRQSGKAMKKADSTVFGIHLGDKFSHSECKRTGVGAEAVYIGPDATTCFRWRYDLLSVIPENTPVVTDEVEIVWEPDEARPLYTRYGWMSGLVVDGRLEKVTVYTGGLSWQDYWLAQLKEKYGEPAILEEAEKENGFGAVFTSHLAKWRFANLAVVFHGTYGSTDTGTVDVVTNKGLEFLGSGRGVDHPMRKGPKM